MADIWELIRDNVKTITPYSPGKSSDEVKQELGIEEVTKLASNENPLGPSPKAVEAMRAAADQMHVYPDPTWASLRQKLGDFYDFDPEGILIGRGSDEVIHMMGLALLDPGDEVVYSVPPFALYPLTATLMDCEHVQVPSTGQKGLHHDLDAMAGAITERTKLIFVCNPCNPTGTLLREDQLDEFMNAVPDHCVVAFDEAYCEYVQDEQFPDTLAYARNGRLCISLRTFSKVYGLAGLRIGYGLADPEVAGAFRLACEPFNASAMSLAAAEAALDDRQQVRRSVEANEAGKKYLYEQFDDMGLYYEPTHANFIFLEVGIDSQECFDELMRRGVTVRTGDIFGFDEWIRVTIGTRQQNERFLGALREVLGK